MNKNLTIIIVTAVIIVLGAFFGGMKYGENKGPLGRQNGFNMKDWANQQNGNGTKIRAGVGFVNGEIIAKDENSITVKLQNEGTKIVFFATSTEISKFASGSLSDLEIGKSVMINGQTNSDGSITAQTIQLRPTQPVPVK